MFAKKGIHPIANTAYLSYRKTQISSLIKKQEFIQIHEQERRIVNCIIKL